MKAFPGLTIDTGRVNGVKAGPSPVKKETIKTKKIECLTNWPSSSEQKASIPNIEILVRVQPEK
jgi:hypothetical protein